ncbi:hypothetical protein IP92_03038 [Pseudoduganella flava]|uniref:Uncharacterized protein n=1 Tax=Pseudoduganella flava TaxID=871742 RepID=A0A562PQF0_9BURK|nr:EboA domain-containing protein [Pseudoduganella flava]QGZ37846.1 hypothetical protein GO485_01480 [Pseudoduganella flava]TWI46675.1 hypothetical protein IP92_03038 [Pseudoduganella flava]
MTTTPATPLEPLLKTLLTARLAPAAQAFIAEGTAELARAPERLPRLIALASRAVRAGTPLASDDGALAQARALGFDPARWSTLETARIVLVLHCQATGGDAFDPAFLHCLRYADHGELCALYRSLPLLPDGERFVVQAAEACRSNMRTLFEAVACDSPYPARHFDSVAWNQLVLKAVFIDAPLWRVHGLDDRLSPELARMALDFADERKSAGRPVPPQLWLCLGPHGGARALLALSHELDGAVPLNRAAALFALVRAGAREHAAAWRDGSRDLALEAGAVLRQQDFSHAAFGRLFAHHAA